MSTEMTGSTRSGLCIDIPTLKLNPESSDLPYPAPATTGQHTHRASVASLFPEASASFQQPIVARTHDTHKTKLTKPPESNFSLRSVTGMQGLLLAENGGGLVELDPLGGGSGFKQGTQVMPGLVTPRGGAFGIVGPSLVGYEVRQKMTNSGSVSGETRRLSRHGTLLSQGATPARNAAELKSLLGNSRSKVKSGAKILPPPNLPTDMSLAETDAPAVALEQGKSRARVEVDILLDSEIFVEGGYITGKLHIRVRKRGTKDQPVFLAGGKMRVVGFEGIPNNNDRHTFYQHAAPLSTITVSSHVLYASPSDEEGFSRAREGMHIIPFAMRLPISDGIHVGAKGPFDDRSGIVIKYIVIASFKLKDDAATKRSIAHFYRSCEIYPYLNATLVMAPATHPLLSTAARSLFLGGTGKLKLTASLHRNIWVAGQRCCVGIAVHNESKKTVKGLILSLIRTTTVFLPHPHLDVASPSSADPDACQTTTTRKLVAETTLEAGQRGLKGHVTAKGWWTGVEPGVRTNFAHFILLPPNALSIVRSRLLEVQYAIRVSLVAGSLSSEVSVMLPVRIVNHLSIDPPPSYPTPFDQPGIRAPVPPLPVPASGAIFPDPPVFSRGATTQEARNGEGDRQASIFGGMDARDLVYPYGAPVLPLRAISGGSGPLPSRIPSIMPRLAEEDPESEPSSSLHPEHPHGALEEGTDLHNVREDDNEVDYSEHEHDTREMAQDSAEDLLGNLSMEDSDEEVEFVIGSARLEDDDQSVTRFTEFHIANEETLHVGQTPVESTVSSRSTYSMPSGEDHVSEERLTMEPPSQKTPRERLMHLAHSRARLRPKTPDLAQGSSNLFVKLPPPRLSPTHPVPARPRANRLEAARSSGGFPFPSQLPQKLSGAPPYKRSPFSQRVDRLVAARRAAVKPPTPSMTSDGSDGDGTPGMSTGGTSTQTETSSSEMSPSTSPTLPVTLTSAMPPRLRSYTISPSKVPMSARSTSASTASPVRSRIAELEGLCKAAPSCDVSSASSRPN